MSVQRSDGVTQLLARVKNAVRAQPVTAHHCGDAAVARRTVADTSAHALAEMFAQRAQGVGMRVSRCSEATFEATLTTIVTAHATPAPLGTVIAMRDSLLATRVHAALSACNTMPSRNDNADALFDCAIGVTDVDCALADSGSLVINTNGRIRNAWITPPIHIAIVRSNQILPDLVDLFDSRGDTLDAASTTIITGPSKTADIEGVLVTGVHGPAFVEIILLGE